MYNKFMATGNPSKPGPFEPGGGFPLVLGERLNGIQEVSGSIPLISTKSSLGEGKNLEIN